jgi:hypothetical protein
MAWGCNTAWNRLTASLPLMTEWTVQIGEKDVHGVASRLALVRPAGDDLD